MTDILYYPLVDCDPEGLDKMSMIPTSSMNAVKMQSRMWLEEIVPHYYRLYTENQYCPTDAYSIRCPMCGKPLRCISRDISNTKRGLYVCSSCGND